MITFEVFTELFFVSLEVPFSAENLSAILALPNTRNISY